MGRDLCGARDNRSLKHSGDAHMGAFRTTVVLSMEDVFIIQPLGLRMSLTCAP